MRLFFQHRNFLFLLVLLLSSRINSYAQDADSSSSGGSRSTDRPKMNMVKINLTSLALKTYSIQYERVLNKTFSIAISARTMPTTSIPFKNRIIDAIGEGDEDITDLVNDFQLSNIAFTPEIRIYTGRKGYGRGFYLAPFYRYAKYETSTLNISYESISDPEASISLEGDLTAHTFGLMMGAQWSLGRHLCLDWWIFGPHYGTSEGDFLGKSSVPLTPAEQEEIRQQLEDLEIPLVESTIKVDANSAALKLKGPWAGIRAGISFGFKF